MFTIGPAFWAGAASGSSGLTLPYNLTFNQASKSAMLSAYSADGITISPLLDGSGGGFDEYEGGLLLLSSNYDDFAFPTPTAPVSGGNTAYIRANSFGASLPQDIVISLPAGTPAKRVNFDYWASGNTGVDDALLIVTYSDTSSQSRGLNTPSAASPFVRLGSDFPTTPPGGSAYITSITIRQSNECIVSIDNLTFYS